MAFEQRDNTGSLFRNDRASSDRHPSHKGTVMVDGVEYWISAWVKEGKKGRFFSLAFEPKENRDDIPFGSRETKESARQPAARSGHGQAAQGRPEAPRASEDEDDIPF